MFGSFFGSTKCDSNDANDEDDKPTARRFNRRPSRAVPGAFASPNMAVFMKHSPKKPDLKSLKLNLNMHTASMNSSLSSLPSLAPMERGDSKMKKSSSSPHGLAMALKALEEEEEDEPKHANADWASVATSPPSLALMDRGGTKIKKTSSSPLLLAAALEEDELKHSNAEWASVASKDHHHQKQHPQPQKKQETSASWSNLLDAFLEEDFLNVSTQKKARTVAAAAVTAAIEKRRRLRRGCPMRSDSCSRGRTRGCPMRSDSSSRGTTRSRSAPRRTRSSPFLGFNIPNEDKSFSSRLPSQQQPKQEQTVKSHSKTNDAKTLESGAMVSFTTMTTTTTAETEPGGAEAAAAATKKSAANNPTPIPPSAVSPGPAIRSSSESGLKTIVHQDSDSDNNNSTYQCFFEDDDGQDESSFYSDTWHGTTTKGKKEFSDFSDLSHSSSRHEEDFVGVQDDGADLVYSSKMNGGRILNDDVTNQDLLAAKLEGKDSRLSDTGHRSLSTSTRTTSTSSSTASHSTEDRKVRRPKEKSSMSKKGNDGSDAVEQYLARRPSVKSLKEKHKKTATSQGITSSSTDKRHKSRSSSRNKETKEPSQKGKFSESTSSLMLEDHRLIHEMDSTHKSQKKKKLPSFKHGKFRKPGRSLSEQKISSSRGRSSTDIKCMLPSLQLETVVETQNEDTSEAGASKRNRKSRLTEQSTRSSASSQSSVSNPHCSGAKLRRRSIECLEGLGDSQSREEGEYNQQRGPKEGKVTLQHKSSTTRGLQSDSRRNDIDRHSSTSSEYSEDESLADESGPALQCDIGAFSNHLPSDEDDHFSRQNGFQRPMCNYPFWGFDPRHSGGPPLDPRYQQPSDQYRPPAMPPGDSFLPFPHNCHGQPYIPYWANGNMDPYFEYQRSLIGFPGRDRRSEKHFNSGTITRSHISHGRHGVGDGHSRDRELSPCNGCDQIATRCHCSFVRPTMEATSGRSSARPGATTMPAESNADGNLDSRLASCNKTGQRDVSLFDTFGIAASFRNYHPRGSMDQAHKMDSEVHPGHCHDLPPARYNNNAPLYHRPEGYDVNEYVHMSNAARLAGGGTSFRAAHRGRTFQRFQREDDGLDCSTHRGRSTESKGLRQANNNDDGSLRYPPMRSNSFGSKSGRSIADTNGSMRCRFKRSFSIGSLRSKSGRSVADSVSSFY